MISRYFRHPVFRTSVVWFVFASMFLYSNLVRHIMMQQARLRTEHPTTMHPATDRPTLTPSAFPTTMSPSRSPTFYDYINELHTYPSPVVGWELGSVANSTRRCTKKLGDSVAVLHYSNRSLDVLSSRPKSMVTLDGVFVGHDWPDFVANLPRMNVWVGDETSNCGDWVDPSAYGLMMGSRTVDFPCTDSAKILCLRVIRL